ncbi:MAG: DUF1566 domain-containing protein [Sulfurospirillum sp.]|nr:DUF1566 domain-containing protein [Sulfurospirillum sp.]
MNLCHKKKFVQKVLDQKAPVRKTGKPTCIALRKTLIMLTAVSSILSSQYAMAQQCKTDSIASSNNPKQFVINTQQGTVIDARTGLEWSICSLGQKWQNGNCLDAPTKFDDFSAALTEVNNSTAADADWEGYRLPNIKELGSIIERSCSSPAISLTAFTGTLNAVYYSSTPDNTGNSHFSPILGVKVIDFTNGSEFVPDVSKFRYVRLVKTIN